MRGREGKEVTISPLCTEGGWRCSINVKLEGGAERGKTSALFLSSGGEIKKGQLIFVRGGEGGGGRGSSTKRDGIFKIEKEGGGYVNHALDLSEDGATPTLSWRKRGGRR